MRKSVNKVELKWPQTPPKTRVLIFKKINNFKIHLKTLKYPNLKFNHSYKEASNDKIQKIVYI